MKGTLLIAASIVALAGVAAIPSASATPIVDCVHEYVVSERFTTIGTLGETEDDNEPMVDALVNEDEPQAESKAIEFATGGYTSCLS